MDLPRKAVSGSLLLKSAVILIAAIGMPEARAAAAEDVVVRRDGSRSGGQLKACAGTSCNWNGTIVPRSEVAWIGLGEGGAMPVPEDPARDQVWLRDGRTVVGEIVGLSLGSVAMESDSFERPDVRWIYFGSTEGVPRQSEPPLVAAAPSTTGMVPPPATESVAETTPAAVEPSTPAAPATPALRLNEVLFRPQEKRAPFVEIVNIGTGVASLDGVRLRNDKGKFFALPKDGTLAPEGILVVRFDGAKAVEAGVVHAPAGDFLGRAVGAVWLSSRDGTADGVAWGLNQPNAVELCRGGRCSDPAPGSVVARLPDVDTALSVAAWAPLDPEHATPGGPNPRPPVSAFAALPGTVFQGEPGFSWYGVQGAARYRLEVAPEETFVSLVHEAIVTTTLGASLEQLTVVGPQLPPGSYFWRVQAVGSAGEAAAFSHTVPFSVRSPGPAQHAARALPGVIASSHAQSMGGGADGPRSAGARDPIAICPGLRLAPGGGVCKELAVPVIRHEKDTEMLTLEAPNQEPPMGWDKPDVAGYPYCARAGVAMINAYYRAKLHVPGKLSQDRIGFEVFQHLPAAFIGTPWAGGPEYDLPVVGINDDSTRRYSLPLALGTEGNYSSRPDTRHGDRNYCGERNIALHCGGSLAAPRCPPCPVETEYRWGYEALANIKAEIDAERPLIATDPGHLYLIVGYVEKGDEFSIITQDGAGRKEVNLQQNAGEQLQTVDGIDVVTQLDGNEAVSLNLLLESYWTGLAPVNLGSDEESVIDDSDDDGVVDFDEENRFGTNMRERDSDGDGVGDKEEIHYSVWDPDHGYHRTVVSLSPNASLREVAAKAETAFREAMEIAPDSDSGGCKDGEEDVNANGIRDPGETSNFDRSDDPTEEDGTCAGLWTGNVEMRLWTRNPLDQRDIHIEAQVRLREFDLHPLADPGPAHGGREAGARIGSQVRLKCLSMSLHETWRDELRTEAGGEVMVQVATAEGSKTVAAFSPSAGYIFRKTGDLDLTPSLGFDIPRDSGLYAISGCEFEFRNDLLFTHTCSGSRSCYEPYADYSPFIGPWGVGRSPLHPPEPCGDPEVRQLEAGGNRMAGSYSYRVNDGVCVTTHGEVTWSLCKAGTPCAPLPPLPGAPDAPP